MIVNISQFRFFKCEKSVIKHKVACLINKLIDLQENKRLIKRTDEYVEYIYPIFEYPEEITKKYHNKNKMNS